MWHDGAVTDKLTSEQLSPKSNDLLASAAKLIEHAKTIKAQAIELQKQIAQLDRLIKPKKA